MSSHHFTIVPRRDCLDEDPAAGVIRVTDPLGRSFALPYAPDSERHGTLTLRLGVHALCARQLYALAALLENQEQALRADVRPRLKAL